MSYSSAVQRVDGVQRMTFIPFIDFIEESLSIDLRRSQASLA
jgi:predicted ATPase